MTKGEQMAKILADTLCGCPILDPCTKIWASEGWCKDHCKPGQQEPDAECWLKYAETMVKEAENSTESSLTQKELDVPGTNVGDIYECPCGYGWDKSKVFRHHFCPNCGRAVEPSYNLIKTELNGDMISRQAAIDAIERNAYRHTYIDQIVDIINALPSAQPESSTEIQEILNYLDTTLHPIVSPDNWNVYAELHDMVCRLPSAQPEWNNHTVACLLAELFNDPCACNFSGIDEWLPEKCELLDSCPNPVGVACWEQYLKHREERRTDA